MYKDVVPVDLSQVKTYPLSQRKNKVKVQDFASVIIPFPMKDYLQSLPAILAGADIRAIVDAIIHAYRHKRPIIWGIGAHVIKCGLSPWIITLMRCGLISSVAMNGAGAIHDAEIALIGETSEDVAAGLAFGSFGMVRETTDLMHLALEHPEVQQGNMGMGEALGRRLLQTNAEYAEYSILATAAELQIPVTVHVALGTDIVHMQRNDSGALFGQASFTDFRVFVSLLKNIEHGVYLNVGSAVILPEIFLKAFTVVQNIQATTQPFTTVNIDMQQQYRPLTNVLQRPSDVGGRPISITGHHELLIPLLGYALLELVGEEHKHETAG